MALEPQQLLEMYRKMVTIRRFDQRAVEEFQAGNIPGGVHTYIGEEAVAMGVCAALAAKLERSDRVAVAFFGDGASNEGAFHGSLNLASIWKLPVIYVCEHNRWASGVPASYALSVADVSVRAVGYNMPGVTVDGTDVLAVYEATEQAVRRARDGVGPALIECKTYRWRGHSEQRGNPSDPRPGDEIALARQHDPIASFGSRLLEQGVATAARLQQIDAEARAAVEEAVAFAQASPLPQPEDALLDVFAP